MKTFNDWRKFCGEVKCGDLIYFKNTSYPQNKEWIWVAVVLQNKNYEIDFIYISHSYHPNMIFRKSVLSLGSLEERYLLKILM